MEVFPTGVSGNSAGERRVESNPLSEVPVGHMSQTTKWAACDLNRKTAR